MLFQSLDFLFDLLEIRFGRFVLRIQSQSGFIMRRSVGQVLEGAVVRLVHVSTIFESPAKVEMAVLLKSFVGRKQRVTERLKRFVVIAHFESGRAGIEFDFFFLRRIGM